MTFPIRILSCGGGARFFAGPTQSTFFKLWNRLVADDRDHRVTHSIPIHPHAGGLPRATARGPLRAVGSQELTVNTALCGVAGSGPLRLALGL